MDGIEQIDANCGIKKIIDCKFQDGSTYYKVKWEPTWEPAENLTGCQHLVDQFWELVNNTKVHEEEAKQQSRKRMKPDPEIDYLNSYMLGEDSKADIQQLVARTNATQPGPALMSPSAMLEYSAQQSTVSNQSENTKNKEAPALPKPLSSNNSSLAYIESFNNPYVKIVLVCKMCSKEQNIKRSDTWKLHYLTHVPDEEKPYFCASCKKGFIEKRHYDKHMKQH